MSARATPSVLAPLERTSDQVSVSAENITIAITVYNRRDYVLDAIESALAQPHAVKVLVVEDCSPDPSLRTFIEERFGGRIRYLRNPERRGLFGNWNACIEASGTPWLCILHDDDFLETTFVESMTELAAAAPGRALYYGQCNVINALGEVIERANQPDMFSWDELPLEEWARHDPVCFPGQLFNVEVARAVGEFRPSSRYCADWEMWFKLALNCGAAATNRIVANYREYYSVGRGTTEIDVSGRKYACGNVQRKRHFALLRKRKSDSHFDRRAILKDSPMATRYLLEHGRHFSSRMLRYNAGLLFLSKAPHWRYRFFQVVTQLFSWRSLRGTSWLFYLLQRTSSLLHDTKK